MQPVSDFAASKAALKTSSFSEWGHNNPLLIMRVLTRMCETNSTYEMVDLGECGGFHIYPYTLCTPVTGSIWFQLFYPRYLKKAMRKVNESIVVHFSNSLSKFHLLRVDSKVAYVELAKQFCPKSVNLYDIF